jgi:hypothetical protein
MFMLEENAMQLHTLHNVLEQIRFQLRLVTKESLGVRR